MAAAPESRLGVPVGGDGGGSVPCGHDSVRTYTSTSTASYEFSGEPGPAGAPSPCHHSMQRRGPTSRARSRQSAALLAGGQTAASACFCALGLPAECPCINSCRFDCCRNPRVAHVGSMGGRQWCYVRQAVLVSAALFRHGLTGCPGPDSTPGWPGT